MFTTTLVPDFRKLTDYFVNLSEEYILKVESDGGVVVNLKYLDNTGFEQLQIDLASILERYGLKDHYKELLYLILRKNEEIGEKHTMFWHQYNEEKKLKEVATFLLGLKKLKQHETVQLAIKPSLSPTLTINNNEIAEWMIQSIVDNLEKQEFPLSLFGSQIYKLFDGLEDDQHISLDKLTAASKLKLQNPKFKLRPLYVELCLYLQVYLVNQTHLTLPNNAKLSDKQANFFFDILQMLDYITIDDFDSEPKDYIYALFQNNKQVSVYQGNKTD